MGHTLAVSVHTVSLSINHGTPRAFKKISLTIHVSHSQFVARVHTCTCVVSPFVCVRSVCIDVFSVRGARCWDAPAYLKSISVGRNQSSCLVSVERQPQSLGPAMDLPLAPVRSKMAVGQECRCSILPERTSAGAAYAPPCPCRSWLSGLPEALRLRFTRSVSLAAAMPRPRSKKGAGLGK